ncbi:MAG: CDP-glycerol glycerophosphotransferase family protein, partial [Hungatella sp.]
FFNRAYHLATAGTWVDNSRKAFGTAKRKNQLYIQTWHAGVALKPIGQFRGALFPKIAYLVSAYDSKLTDFVLSNSDWCTNLYPKMLIYQGEIIKTGSPRCDILINKKRAVYEDIRSQYAIPKDAKIVMFAPTFRGGSQKGNRQVLAAYPTLNFSTMVQILEEKFGGSWYIFLRLHPQLSAQIEKVPLENSIEQMIDVSQADDMNELLCASDVLITDYSSSSFDAICAYIPVFLYLDDFEEYVQERGNLMWERSALPFSVSTSNHELLENILQFDENDYRKQIDRFQKNTGVLEDGHASARVADIIGSRIL